MTKFATQFEYMEALKRALTMANVPYDKAEAAVADYQQRFLDGLSAGRPEAEIAAELDDPKKVAASLRVANDVVVFKEKKTFGNAVRLFFSILGLFVFNVFMIIPAFMYGVMMFVMYVVAAAIYVGGIAVTSASLAGVSELVLDGPVKHVVMHHEDEEAGERSRVSVKVDSDGVRITPAERDIVIEKDASLDGRLVVSTTAMDDAERKTGLLAGLGLILGGVLLFLVSLVMTRLTWLGLKAYLRMHMDVLRAA